MTFYWHCTPDTFTTYRQILARYEDVEPYSEEAETLKQQLLELPDMPNHLNEHDDIVVPVVEPTPIITVPRGYVGTH